MHQRRTFLGQSRFPAFLLVAKLMQLVSWPTLFIQSIYHDLSSCDLFMHRSIYFPGRPLISVFKSIIDLSDPIKKNQLYFIIYLT